MSMARSRAQAELAHQTEPSQPTRSVPTMGFAARNGRSGDATAETTQVGYRMQPRPAGSIAGLRRVGRRPFDRREPGPGLWWDRHCDVDVVRRCGCNRVRIATGARFAPDPPTPGTPLATCGAPRAASSGPGRRTPSLQLARRSDSFPAVDDLGRVIPSDAPHTVNRYGKR